jgi:hypothetical protein
MRRNTYKRRSTRRRKNHRFSRRRATRGNEHRRASRLTRRQRGGYYAYKLPPWALGSYSVAGEDEAPRMMTAEEIEEQRTEDDKGI